MDETGKSASHEAIFRYALVSHVLCRVQQGSSERQAVLLVAKQTRQYPGMNGWFRKVSVRTLQRWLAAYRQAGIAGLEPRSRPRSRDSTILGQTFVDFAIAQKQQDPHASIPEIIKRAIHHGIVGETMAIDRTTVWRALCRSGLSLQRRKKGPATDKRRFAYAHRMEMILCDGKHFRAGAGRHRRVAFFFLDDATRFGLDVVVGTAESSLLFLTGLHDVVGRYGLPLSIYLDRGSGYTADDSQRVAANLGICLVFGTVAYPEGHGKIERFHRTATAALLRNLDGRPDVDVGCEPLRLRLHHWLTTIYNHTVHESLDGHTPWQRFHHDRQPLRFPDSLRDRDRHFVVSVKRRVSADNTVSVNSCAYEMPRGHAGKWVILHRRVLTNTIHFLDGQHAVELKPVDLVVNARNRRAGRPGPPAEARPLPVSAADSAFRHDYHPIISPDGGFTASDLPEATFSTEDEQ